MTGALTVLIADDTDSDRLILETIVRKEGHRVVSVRDGEEAVAVFREQRPDLVLMDALMPRLDGFEAARRIKQLAGEELVPIIFLTSLTDTDSLVKCLDAGGDDFLSKPYNQVIINAKIKAFRRMREMHQVMQEQRDQIAQHHAHLLREQEVAKEVFDNIAHTGCLNAANVRYLLSPLAVFNGDVILAARRPSGSMMVLLGDFTGHGLPAAVGAMPLASSFYGMVSKGFSASDILREINQRLKQILPVGVFCCAALVDMNFAGGQIKIWNGGLPDCYLRRREGGPVVRIASTHLPLGVLDDTSFRDDFLRLEMAPGDHLYLWSDGIIEARSPAGVMFGDERLQQLFEQSAADADMFSRVLTAVHEHCEDSPDDDLSLVELTMLAPDHKLVCPDWRLEDLGPVRYAGLQEWSLRLELETATLRHFDPMPLLLNILAEVPGLRSHSSTLYTILAELYSNSLEHGILALPSEWKSTPEGFERYYAERRRRLEQLQQGYIAFSLRHRLQPTGGCLTIRVSDSGDGFHRATEIVEAPSEQGYSGRGIPLVRSLCQSLRYLEEGNQVEAVFVWQDDD